ncbi:uncharacterized protein LOC111629473 [Centruroides sculpturatus]|uniref:uncharacterized protein LOC111629473 n=1 Tax=Centruroides sculpturatus TaxID=218467 RepID=UPI000C6E7284|nr:uncharacterized protein LOC111629473 [Centruroides sculpturatus]
MAKEVRKKWNCLKKEDKEKYIKMAEEDKKRYCKEKIELARTKLEDEKQPRGSEFKESEELADEHPDSINVYGSSKSVVENCLSVQQYEEDLKAEGETIKESWIMTRMLGILPPKLYHFRTSWDNANSMDKNIDTLIERLRLEKDRLKEDDKKESTAQNALISKQKTQEILIIVTTATIRPFRKGVCINEKSDESNKGDKTKGQRRALVTVGLTSTKINDKNSRRNRQDIWYQDSVATQRMTFRKEWLTNYKAPEEYTKVILGNNPEINGIRVGDIELEAFNGREWYPATPKDVLYVPNISFNLFSVTKMLDKGFVQTANANTSIIETVYRKEQIAVAQRLEELYQMMFRREVTGMCTMDQLNQSLTHQNVKYCKSILDRNNIRYIDDWDNNVFVSVVYRANKNISLTQEIIR